MQRYFFNVFDSHTTYDEVGTMLSGGTAVRLHMLSLAAAILAETNEVSKDWKMEALDGRGEIVCSLRFGVRP